MPLYQYKAIDVSGKFISGSLDAGNVNDLELRLEKMEMDLVTFKQKEHGSDLFGRNKIGRRDLIISTLLEFALLGALSGLVAAISASAIGYSLASAIFNLPWSFNPAMWVVAIAGGAAGVGLAGILASWRLINKPPIVVLREL